MGTRADFYVGRGEDAEWLGSIAWDGYPEGIASPILQAKTELMYRGAVDRFLRREDGTLPEMGWPWPWENSSTTDFSYAFDNSRVYASCFGSEWTDKPLVEDVFDDLGEGVAVFPDMSTARHARAGTKRSGVTVISTPVEGGTDGE